MPHSIKILAYPAAQVLTAPTQQVHVQLVKEGIFPRLSPHSVRNVAQALLQL